MVTSSLLFSLMLVLGLLVISLRQGATAPSRSPAY
ncbi:MAG: hypothetical protein JWP58_560 [Hymenobacter sp.]|nr:hypothetical protein [Hymenobacter sp.]